MSGRGHVLLVNEHAGSHDRERVDALADALRDDGTAVAVEATGGPDDVDRVMASLDGRVLVVAGGDGSVHLAVGRARAAGWLDDITFGLYPLGTGNDLAGHLGLPADPGPAAALLRDGRPRPLDLLADDEDGVVVNVVHAGLGAEASALAAPVKDVAGPLAYPLGALVAGATESGWDLTVTVDGAPLSVDGPALLVAVGTGATIGGGTPILPAAVVDDGRLDVMVSGATGAVARGSFAADLRDGRHVERDDVAVARGAVVTISGEPTRHCADGEVGEERAAVTYRLVPAAWSLIRP